MKYGDRKTLIARRDSLRRQLTEFYNQLSYLEEQKSKQGSTVSYQITSSIRETDEAIGRIEAELDQILADLKDQPAEAVSRPSLASAFHQAPRCRLNQRSVVVFCDTKS